MKDIQAYSRWRPDWNCRQFGARYWCWRVRSTWLQADPLGVGPGAARATSNSVTIKYFIVIGRPDDEAAGTIEDNRIIIKEGNGSG